jgi:serine protease Do
MTLFEYASGSGFLIDQEGYIVTSNHVIQGADRIRVSLSERQDAVAEVRAIDFTNDLALLKVGPHQVSHIEPVELGDATTVQPGQMVIIIGSPFGLNNSVSVGVSSGVNRVLPGHAGPAISGMLQTDALIAPGNSGGPMLNRSGQAIGITTAMELTSGETTRSIGFAVPSNHVLRLMAQLNTQGLNTQG